MIYVISSIQKIQNTEFNQLIDCVCDDNPSTWPEAVRSVQYIYAHSTSRNATAGCCPYELLFHQHPNRLEQFAVTTTNRTATVTCGGTNGQSFPTGDALDKQCSGGQELAGRRGVDMLLVTL